MKSHARQRAGVCGWFTKQLYIQEGFTVKDQCQCGPRIFPPQTVRPGSVNKPEDGTKDCDAMQYRRGDFSSYNE